jgi:hypothetical protein
MKKNEAKNILYRCSNHLKHSDPQALMEPFEEGMEKEYYYNQNLSNAIKIYQEATEDHVPLVKEDLKIDKLMADMKREIRRNRRLFDIKEKKKKPSKD